MKSCLPFWLVVLLVCRLNAPAHAQPTDTLATQRVLTFLDALQNGPLARNGTVALSVRRTRDGQSIVAYNDHKSLSTASTLKLITTATALAVLGPTFSYTTTLEYDGQLTGGILMGNVYLRGTGDPSLGSWRFVDSTATDVLMQTLAKAVKRAGIRTIAGTVVGDGSLYAGQPTPDTWPWGDLGNYYGAGLFGLNLNENLYRVFFRPGKTLGAGATVLRTDPLLPYLTLTNTVTTDAAGTGDQVTIYSPPLGMQQWLTGKVPLATSPRNQEFSVKGALPDPPYHAAFRLDAQLRADSVLITHPPTAFHLGNPAPKAKPHRTTLYQHQSPLLTDLARQTNYESLNGYAEALLRTTALALNPTVRTFDESVEAVAAYWKAKGVNLEGFLPKDGSGLSTVGALTADNMTGILTAMSHDKAFPAFYQSIPVVGQSGTVRNLARNTVAAGRVRAKSGSIEGVRAYAGYFTTTGGEQMAFSVMVNKITPDTSVTSRLGQLLVLLVGL